MPEAKQKKVVMVMPLAGNGRDFSMYDYLINELENHKIKARVQEITLTPALEALLAGKSGDGHYLLALEGDVEPTLHGPYETVPARDAAAGEYRARHGDEDGLYQLDVVGGAVSVESYSGAYLARLAEKALRSRKSSKTLKP